jgi:Arm DNA-binding domain
MASRRDNRLTARVVEQTKRPGYYGDGGGLVLRVADGGSKGWLYRYKTNGKVREMGLGPVRDVTLAEAREAASEARRLRRTGVDPIDAKRQRRIAAQLDAAKATTFSQCAAAYIENHRASWSNGKMRPSGRPHFGLTLIPSLGISLLRRSIPVS